MRRVAVLGLCVLAAHRLDAGTRLDVPIVLTQVPRQKRAKYPDPREQQVSRDWFEGSRLVVLLPNGQVRILSKGFAAACDPSVSFDATSILFAGKKEAGSSWRIYEMNTNGEGVRAVSPENMEARGPLYVSTLFTLDSPQPWFTMLFVARESAATEAGRLRTWNLYDLKLDGTELRRLTYNPNDNYDPVQMWDGRVVYSAERHAIEAGSNAGRVGLYAIHIEGADMELFGGERSVRNQHMTCSLELDRLVFVEPERDAWDGAGQLACVEEPRPHLTYERLTESSKQLYLFPAPFRGKRILVSRRAASGRGTAGIFLFDIQTRQSEVLFDSPDFDDLQAKVLAPHARPDGHSTVVEQAATNGTFYGLNCYDAEPRLAEDLPPGTVKRVRFIEGVVPTNCAPSANCSPAPLIPRRLVGEAPVEADGSFNVVVPSNIPLLLQTLDERGMALATCGWIWVKNKETRGCIGCHEDPERTPENEYVLALHRESDRLSVPADQRRLLTFRDDIAPVLKTHCATAECHAGRETPLRLALSEPASGEDLQRAYNALLVPEHKASTDHGKYIDPGRARTSWLVWQLCGEKTSRPWDQFNAQAGGKAKKITKMPPPEKGVAPLSAEELKTIIQWVDLGAPFGKSSPVASALSNAQAQLR